MFKTIFSKLIAIFLVILLFSFSVTGVILYYFLGNLVSNEKVNAFKKTSDNLENIIKTIYKENLTDAATLRLFQYALDASSSNTRTLIWIVDPSGHIAFTTSGVPGKDINDKIISKLTNKSGHLQFPDERQYKKIMQGVEPIIQEQGDFYGLFKDTGAPWLTIEKPVKVLDASGKETVFAAIYLNTPLPEVQRLRVSVFRLFIFSVGISVLMAIVLVYVFSLKITRPLKQIKNAAKVIAGGEFQKRLDIKSPDEIGQLASSFNQMAFELQKLEEMRRGFIANVSHELRTPMTSIRGFIEGILDGTIPPERHETYLTIVRDETNRLNRMVNNLLDLARMESGEAALNFKTININELVRRCIIKLESLIIEKDIQVEANFEHEEMFAIADPDAIERVIINLLHNAIKFTQESGKITLNTLVQKERILVSVGDNGIGIDKDEIPFIWDRFYKSDKSRSMEKNGTGLGLAIIKSIINEHNQEIWVESELGKGTKFTFTLSKVSENKT